MRTFIANAGFTLIELLAVILLLGLGLGVGLTLDFAGSPQQQKQHTTLLANLLETAAQDAVLDSRVLGLDFFTNEAQLTGYRLLQLRDGSWSVYAPRDERANDAHESMFPEELRVTLALTGATVSPEPRMELPPEGAFAPEILLLPSRELTPFMLSLTGAAGAASVLTADLMGRIRVDADAPPPP